MAHEHTTANCEGSDCTDQQVYIADLNALNSSGVDGFAIIATQADGSIKVNVVADGLEADQPHIQHIHGFLDDSDSTSPTIAQDADNDGFVELGEGLANYGPILLNLTSPETAADEQPDGTFGGMPDLAGFPTAPNGEVNFQETYTFTGEDGAALLASLGPIENKELVIHGLSVDEGSGAGTEGEIDGTAGFKAALPVASGEFEEITGESAQTVLKMLDELGDDASAAEVSSAFHTALALQFAAAGDDGAASASSTSGDDAADDGAANDNADDDDGAQNMQVASAHNHGGDMMMA